VFEIFWHLVYFSNPSLQRYVIRILWMVPIYGIESWFALRYTVTENVYVGVYLQAFREFYEAYVIWSFLHFLMSFLGTILLKIVFVFWMETHQKYIFDYTVVSSCCVKCQKSYNLF